MEVPGQNCKSELAKFAQVDIKVIQKLYMLEFLEFSFFPILLPSEISNFVKNCVHKIKKTKISKIQA